MTSIAPRASIEVQKFGSSVLRTPADLPIAIDEIYRRWRAGCRVLAVVSAIAPISAEKWTGTYPGETRDFLPSLLSIRKTRKWTAGQT
jgi:hypothetical protein